MIIQVFSFWDWFPTFAHLCIPSPEHSVPSNQCFSNRTRFEFSSDQAQIATNNISKKFHKERMQSGTGHCSYPPETRPADFCPILQGVARAGQWGSRPIWPQDEPKQVLFQRQRAGLYLLSLCPDIWFSTLESCRLFCHYKSMTTMRLVLFLFRDAV